MHDTCTVEDDEPHMLEDEGRTQVQWEKFDSSFTIPAARYQSLKGSDEKVDQHNAIGKSGKVWKPMGTKIYHYPMNIPHIARNLLTYSRSLRACETGTSALWKRCSAESNSESRVIVQYTALHTSQSLGQ